MGQEHQTKQAIKTAARRLFAKRGYNAVSMRDIAQMIGKQQGGLYNHFPSKQAILVDLMLENLDRAYAAAIAPLAEIVAPDQRLECFVRGHVRHNIENPDDIFIAYMELRSLDPESGRAVFEKRKEYETALRQILRDGQGLGQFTIADPDIHARSILSMLGGVTVWYRETGTNSPEEITESYVQAALQSVGATYTAPNLVKG